MTEIVHVLFYWTAFVIIAAQSKNFLAFGMYSLLLTFMTSTELILAFRAIHAIVDTKHKGMFLLV